LSHIINNIILQNKYCIKCITQNLNNKIVFIDLTQIKSTGTGILWDQ